MATASASRRSTKTCQSKLEVRHRKLSMENFLTVSNLYLDWKPLIKLAAIDCAQDVNTATCRQYDIMGYPSLKFFPPKAGPEDLGELRTTMSNEVSHMMEDMIRFVEKVSQNHSLSAFTSEHRWPIFRPIT